MSSDEELSVDKLDASEGDEEVDVEALMAQLREMGIDVPFPTAEDAAEDEDEFWAEGEGVPLSEEDELAVKELMAKLEAVAEKDESPLVLSPEQVRHRDER
jgi:hypothetical protein